MKVSKVDSERPYPPADLSVTLNTVVKMPITSQKNAPK
jgi:hypothetical protein